MEDSKMARIARIDSDWMVTVTCKQLDVMYDALSRYEGKGNPLDTHEKVVQNARDIVEANDLAELMRTV